MTRSGSPRPESGRSTNALTPLKMAALTPIPRPSVSTATSVNPLLFHSTRSPNRTSVKKLLIASPSFVPESNHRVYLRRAARRDEAGDERDAGRQQRDARVGQRV